MKAQKGLKLLLVSLLLLSAVGCTPWTEAETPDFGEEGSYCPSEKVECFLGGNAGGLSNEAYLARADEAWDLGVEVMVTFAGELFREAPLESLSEAENELLLQIREEVEALDPSTGKPGQIVLKAYSEFLGLDEWLPKWTKGDRLPEPYQIGDFNTAGALDLEWMTELAESPLIRKIEVYAHQEPVNE